MTHNAVGEIIVDSPLLAYDWHTNLSPAKLAAYVRYQFIWQKENAFDWDSRRHSVRNPRWDGGRSNYDGVNYTSRWGEIVKRVRAHDAHPGMWVHAHFSPAAEKQISSATAVLPEIKPNMLHSSMSLKIYNDYVHRIVPEVLWRNYDVAGRTIRHRFMTSKAFNLSLEAQQLYVLCDEGNVTATPFFRHAFAAAGDCQEAVEEYLWLAALDYEVHQPVYDDLMAKHGEHWWLTDPLKAAVINIRTHWENYNG